MLVANKIYIQPNSSEYDVSARKEQKIGKIEIFAKKTSTE